MRKVLRAMGALLWAGAKLAGATALVLVISAAWAALGGAILMGLVQLIHDRWWANVPTIGFRPAVLVFAVSAALIALASPSASWRTRKNVTIRMGRRW